MKPKTQENKNAQKNLAPEMASLRDELGELDLQSVIPPDDTLDKKDKRSDAQRIIDLAEEGKISHKTQAVVTKTLKNPNKMKDKGYQYFMRALAKNKFSANGKNATGFLDALNSGGKAAAEAADILRKLADSASGPIGESVEKKHLKKLNEITQEQVSQNASEREGAQIDKTHLDKTLKLEVNNLSTPEMPKEVLDKLNSLESQELEIINTSNPKYRELSALRKKLQSAENADLKAQLEQQIAKLNKELHELEEKMEAIRVEAREWKNKYVKHFKEIQKIREDSRLTASEAGFNPQTTESLTYWKVGSEDSAVIDIFTGKARKNFGKLTIKEVNFASDEDRESVDPYQPVGESLVTYEDEEGNEETTSARNFRNISRATEATKDYATLEDLNSDIAFETRYTPLEKGQRFSAKVNGKLEQFTIADIVKDQNGELKIKLNKAVIALPKEKIADSVASTYRFDRVSQAFSLGAFASLLKTNSYRREAGRDEVQEILKKSAAGHTQKYNSRIKEGTPRVKKHLELAEPNAPKIPAEGETSEVIFTDENGRKRKATLRVIPPASNEDEETYELEHFTAMPDGPRSYPQLPNSRPDTRKKKTKKRMSRRAFLDGASSGEITDGDSQMPEEDFSKMPAPHEVVELPKLEGPSSVRVSPEALAYDDVYKTGNMVKEEKGFFMETWLNTRFLSVDDLWEMGKAMYEYYVRRFERRQKEKYSNIGKELPFFAPEMQRVNQASENEQVNQFKESFEQKGVFEIEERLRKTHNQDEMKAAFTVLSDKGQLRWDDIEMWRNLNRFLDNDVAIPIPQNGDPYTRLAENDDRTGLDLLRAAIDSLWGEGAYNDWYTKNKSTFQSNAKGYYEEGKQLENLEGGHQRQLKFLLSEHKAGRYVDPQEYEGLILHAIEAGKSSLQAKLYYIIQGVAYENPYGRTILSIDRMAHINSEMLVRFPILEYMSASVAREGSPLGHRFTKDDYQLWLKIFDEGNPKNCEPTESVNQFLWEYVIPSEETQNRINKALRDGERIDHDDMCAYLPPATEGIITDACKSQTGSKKFVTVEGYANAFPGFSQYFKSLAQNNNKKKLIEGVKSYVRYAGIMTKRFEKHKDTYQRLDDATLNSPTIVSSEPPRHFMEELDGIVRAIAAAYDDPDLIDMVELLYTKTGNIASDPKEKKKQQEIDHAFENFGAKLHKVVAEDGGQKMVDIINGTKLTGMKYTSDAEKDRMRAQRHQNAA